MSMNPAVREVTGRWVPIAEEPRWVSLQAKRVQEPPVFGAGKAEPYSAHYELLYGRTESVTFDLAALQTVITIQPAKGEKD